MLNDRPKIRILAAVAHYFDSLGIHKNEFGSYSQDNLNSRGLMFDRTIDALIVCLSELGAEFQIKVYGVENQYIRRPDVILENVDPKHIPFLTLDDMRTNLEDFDYFLFIEDDIELPSNILKDLLGIDSHLEIDETIIPNRLENRNGIQFCVDLVAMPGFKNGIKLVNGNVLAQSVNPHSGFMFMSREKFARAYSLRKCLEPTIIIGDFMASALANIHSSLKTYRSLPTSEELSVFHQDSWSNRMLLNGLMKENDLRSLIDEVQNLENLILKDFDN